MNVVNIFFLTLLNKILYNNIMNNSNNKILILRTKLFNRVSILIVTLFF